MADGITLAGFSKAIQAALAEYGAQAEQAIKDAAIDTAAYAVVELKKTSPRRTGKYARAWRYDVMNKRLGIAVVVHNKEGQLTHLLEKEHAKRGGGRYYPEQSGTIHIAPAEEHAIERFEEELRKRL